jgi:hypothetical protein
MPVLASVTDVVVAPGDSTTAEGRAGLFSQAVAATRQASALQNARDFNVICSYQACGSNNERERCNLLPRQRLGSLSTAVRELKNTIL